MNSNHHSNFQASAEFIAEAEAKGIMTPEADKALTEYLLGQEAARPIMGKPSG